MSQLTSIYIKDMRLRAFHGCLEQERTVGNDYIVNLEVVYPWQEAAADDDLTKTLNYAAMADIIKHEMAIPANLLESVAQRIARSIISLSPLIATVQLDIMKVAPPMSCDCQGAGVTIRLSNDQLK